MDISGKYFVTVLFIIALIISNILMSPVVFADNTYSWVENSYNSFDLSNYTLRLPIVKDREQDFKVFSPGGQEKLLNIASFYGEDNSNLSLQVPVEGIEKNIKFNNVSSIEFKPLPNIKVDANYEREQEGQEEKIEKNINLKYQVNEKTWLRAGYLLANKEWWDIKRMSLQEEELEEDTDVITENESESVNIASEQEDEPEEEDVEISEMQQPVEPEKVYNFEQIHKSNVGISYKTSDKVTVSADYISGDIFTGEISSTIIGVEYADDRGGLRANYKIDEGKERKETVTGLELDLKDLVTFSASYKLLDPKWLQDNLYNNQEQLKESLNEETVWDFGVDFNLSDISSLSIGYKLINNNSEEKKDESDDKNEKESSIKASFQIDF